MVKENDLPSDFGNFPMVHSELSDISKILIMHQYLETGGNFEINIWNTSIDS